MDSNIIIADNQDITCEGLTRVCEKLSVSSVVRVADKLSLMKRLAERPESIVVLDYTIFDINDVDELLIMSQKHATAMWILFSEELSRDFVRRLIVMSTRFSVVMKESPLAEIKAAVSNAVHGNRFICQRMAEQLIAVDDRIEESINLTPTEKEILKDIALGMTTKEIAEKRVSSFHTVNTHRKNIFRKLGVNNAHEATRYAFRAGLVDAAEYYI